MGATSAQHVQLGDVSIGATKRQFHALSNLLRRSVVKVRNRTILATSSGAATAAFTYAMHYMSIHASKSVWTEPVIGAATVSLLSTVVSTEFMVEAMKNMEHCRKELEGVRLKWALRKEKRRAP